MPHCTFSKSREKVVSVLIICLFIFICSFRTANRPARILKALNTDPKTEKLSLESDKNSKEKDYEKHIALLSETFPPGTLIIPMDNTLQGSGGVFRMETYGLLVRLLHADVPLKWAIKSGKQKDGVDFTVKVKPLGSSNAQATYHNFIASAFIVFPGFEAEATSVINTYGNNISVYELTESSTIEIYSNILHKPKAALLDNGGNVDIHEDVYEEANLIEGVHYEYVNSASELNSSSCFTFASEPHTKPSQINTSVVNQVKEFLQSGGNFLAQCEGVEAYANSQNGSLLATYDEKPGIDGDIVYDNFDEPYAQFAGSLDDEGGSVKSFIFTNDPSGGKRIAYDDEEGNNYKAYVGRQTGTSTAQGGYIHYLAGHKYDGNGLGQINGQRLLMNALMRPSDRPASCDLSMPPLALPDLALITECGQTVSVNVKANDINPSGLPLSLSINSNGNYGTFQVTSANTISYTLESDFFPGEDVGVYELCDNMNNCGTAQIIVSAGQSSLIQGTVFDDANQNGTFNANESGIQNVIIEVYRDTDGNGFITGSDQFLGETPTNNFGKFFYDVQGLSADFALRLKTSTLPDNSLLTTDNIEIAAFTAPGAFDCKNNFGLETDADYDCDINIAMTDPVYNDNGTLNNYNDDTFTFQATISGTGSSGWTGGGTSGAFGQTVNFGPYPVDEELQILTISKIGFEGVCRAYIGAGMSSCCE